MLLCSLTIQLAIQLALQANVCQYTVLDSNVTWSSPETQSALFPTKENLRLFLPDLFSTPMSLGNILPLNASFQSISSIYACSIWSSKFQFHSIFCVCELFCILWFWLLICPEPDCVLGLLLQLLQSKPRSCSAGSHLPQVTELNTFVGDVLKRVWLLGCRRQ